MSDAPENPDRVWDAGLRDEDVVALIACLDGPRGPQPASRAAYFSVRSLRDSVDQSRLGPPKSASEGAERDRTWPSSVPARPGTVESVSRERLVVVMDGDGASARRQSYNLNGKHAYVAVGDAFEAKVSILAGVPDSMADLDALLPKVYQPLRGLASQNVLDRYAAAKALRFRRDLIAQSVPALEALLNREEEARVALEAAGTALALGSREGEHRIEQALLDEDRADLSMEALFILTELGNDFAKTHLRAAAARAEWRADERRQAAIWGLGKSGLKSYADLVPFIADQEENMAFHAISAFGADTPKNVIDELIRDLTGVNERRAGAASLALSTIGSALVLTRLIEAVNAGAASNWLLATIGRLSPEMVRAALRGTPLLARLEPLLLLAPGGNWLSSDEIALNLSFLLKQNL